MADAPELGEFGFAGDDAVVPFAVEALDARGRAVQLGSMVDAILERHRYPEPVSRLLAEMVVLTVLLGTSLKFQGKFIAQTQTDGPVDLLVVDFTMPSSVRAYARFDEERLQAAVAAGEAGPAALLGHGILALTIDQGEHTQRYQGIVELSGSSLEEVAETYFRQSEQIPTTVRLAVARIARRVEAGGFAESWRAGGLIAQFLPEAPERMRLGDLPGGWPDTSGRVVFSAPFRSYGRLLIVDCGGGYHFVLAGLDRLDAEPGQRVLAGEAVGTLGNAGVSGGGRATLYLELRRSGQPVDPAGWTSRG